LGEGEHLHQVAGHAGVLAGKLHDDAHARRVAEGAEDGGGALFVGAEALNRFHGPVQGLDVPASVS
jgi:hypothetical protein